MASPLAAGHPSQAGLLDLERELLCSICTETLYQPLTLIDCLHTFCGSCLKEWFRFEFDKSRSSSSSSRSNPYTCPTCRAQVKDARHNATVSTLLEMFLAANPARAKSAQDKADIGFSYKLGENILPALERGTGRRSRRRGEDDRVDQNERRQLDEARERSVREMGGTAAQVGSRLAVPDSQSRHSHSRSRSSESRDRRIREEERREERRARRRRAEAAEEQLREREATAISRNAVPSVSLTTENLNNAQLSPPPTSPRHPSAIEARQRQRQIAPQTSLRSLMSSSESGTGTGDSVEAEQILQQIIEEGMLEGLDLQELDHVQRDALSERIAEAYRQRRHRRNGHPSGANPQDADYQEDRDSRIRTRIQESPQESPLRHHHRSHSAQGASATETRRHAGPSDRRPPSSRSGFSDPAAPELSPRRASQHERIRSAASLVPGADQHHASRSAIDLSNHTRAETDRVANDHRRLSSGAGRTNTEPEPVLSVSERWRRTAQAGERSPQNRYREMSPTQNGATGHSSTRADGSSRAHLTQSRSGAVTKPATPSISCASCSRTSIEYDLHKHCSNCSSDVCLRCYRTVPSIAFGCDPNSMEQSAPNIPTLTSPTGGEAHRFTSRKYLRPEETGTIAPSDSRSPDAPTPRLQEGKFCDLCHSFADQCYWSCDTCNRGDWGFCNSCINSHHCCTHPLLPLTHRLHAPKTPTLQQGPSPDSGVITLTPTNLHAEVLPSAIARSPASTSSSSTTGANRNPAATDPDYLPLTFTTNCDICTYPIPPSHTRFHCPSHHRSPNPTPNRPTTTPNSDDEIGDYDICTNCYLNLVKTRKIRKEDGPNGWRRCPQGHRMIVIGFDDTAEGQRRTVVEDLVGGHSLQDSALITSSSSSLINATTNHDHHQNNNSSSSGGGSSNAGRGGGQWSWLSNSTDGTLQRESRTSHLRQSATTTTTATAPTSPPPPSPTSSTSTTNNNNNTTTTTTTKNTNTNKTTSTPGLSVLALHPWYPEEGNDGAGELLFPRFAELREVEDVNGDWWAGVYAGVAGVFPGGCVRVLM